MIRMSWFCGVKAFWIGATAVVLLVGAGCSRPVGVPAEEGSAQTGQTPFHDDAAPSSTALADYYSSGDSSKNSENHLPFHDSQDLPAGTLLMVRLNDAIAAGKSGVLDSFVASLDEAVVVGGNTLIPRGAAVIGRVESAHTSNLKPNRGYLRLVLESVHVGGGDLPVQTASLFVRQSPKDDASGSQIRLEKGRQLTFRLSEPAYTVNHTGHVDR
jgi:hypothetical protein